MINEQEQTTQDLRDSLSVLHGELTNDLNNLNTEIANWKKIAPADKNESEAHYNASKALHYFESQTRKLSKKYELMICSIANARNRQN
ncbi:MAG: hypothetical protein JSS83_17485 [Cyanobacteria bacterium SZAS LIN-3]|nr:hypothetical protein [Cyanobacteria bacterium SZAS LIN-3]